MKEDDFREWLQAGGAQTEKGRNTRVYAVKTIERGIVDLGSPCTNLEEAWAKDSFSWLRERLREMRKDARNGGDDYRILMPNSEKPMGRLSNWGTWLNQYGRFLSGDAPGQAKDADRIRKYVLEHYIETARDDGHNDVEVLVRDVNVALGLDQAWPNICQSLAGRIFQEMAVIPPPKLIGANQSPATVFRFDLKSGDAQELQEKTTPEEQKYHTMSPVNLILHGPPGTGKTYATAAEAVRLCGEEVPLNRVDLMAAYNRLCQSKRIEFVTFHQSMSYENFVEGKQPETGDDGEGAETAGFRLETVPGIFRRICRRAETSRGQSPSKDAISVQGRQVFKMSIGEAANPEDAHLFEEAINGGYALLGFDDIDWSDEKYADRDEILASCIEHSSQEDGLNARKGPVQMPHIFRNWVKPRDLLIVSKGNSHFRAIGEFTGEYEFHPRPEGGYAHRRTVRWFWTDRIGVPVSEIYSRRFSMKSIYVLFDAEINVPALERYVNSQRAQGKSTPESFVLIVDEINRANISKVFGELITLLEPDKRLGQTNQIKVRLPYSGDEFGVPANLHIIGTMNTADRSIALLDTALRRRFEFRELMPNSLVLDEAKILCGVDLPLLLTTLNERIEYIYDREHQIGHAYFVNCTTVSEVDDVMRRRVIPLLAEYFYEDWTKVAAILGDAALHEGEIKGGFLNRTVLKPLSGLDSDEDAPHRFRWSVRDEKDGFDYSKLLGT